MLRSLLNRLGLAVALVTAPAILIEACDQTATTSDHQRIAGIELATSTGPIAGIGLGIKVGGVLQLFAQGRDATGAPIPAATISWSSNAPSVATVSQTGLVKGIAPGNATITAANGTVTAALSLAVLDTTTPPPPPPTGTDTLLRANFSSDAAGWYPAAGTWSVSNGVYQNTANASAPSGGVNTGDNFSWAGSSAWTDYSVSAKVRPMSWTGSFGLARVMGRWQSVSAWYYVNLTSDGHVQLRKYVAGVPTDLAPPVAYPVTLGTQYTLRLTMVGTSIRAYVNDVLVLSATDATFSAGAVALGGWNDLAQFDDVIVLNLSGSTPPPPPPPPPGVVVGSVTVAPTTASLAAGATQQLAATVKDTGGITLTGQAVTWVSLHPSWATVSSTGLVTGIAAGVDTVTATSSGKVGRSVVTVTSPPPPPPTTGPVGHVVIVTEENTDYANSVGSMPWLDAQRPLGGVATNYYATTHPSIGNYFMLATGQNITNNDGYSTIVNVDNIVRRLLAAGKTWKSYAEDLPSVGYLGGDQGGYARKHNVFALLSDVANDPNQAKNIVPFTQFKTDLANGTLPTFSNVVPNLCNDAHDCSVGTADTWLKNNIAPLLTNAQFQKDGLLIITFDESGGDNTNGGGKVEWVAIGPTVKHGYASSATYLHPSTLRTMLQALGITTYPGAAASAPYMGEFLNATVGTTPPPPATGSCTSWSGSTITLSGLSTTPYQNTSMADNTRIDATRAQWLLNQPDTWNRMDGGSGACWMGGQILGQITPAIPYDDALSGFHLIYGLIADADAARVENATIFATGDGIAFDSPAADHWTVRGTRIRYAKDDAVESDFVTNGLIDDVLVEGAYTFISSRPYTGSPDGTNNTITVQNSMAWIEGMESNYYGLSRPGTGGFWKWAGSGWPNVSVAPSLIITNSIFRADAAPVEGEGSGEYFAPPKLKSCSNNVLIWLGSGTMPRAWPSCFQVMTGQTGLDYWNQHVASWKAAHPAGADVAPPIISLFNVPSTLSGTVRLMATALDDQTLASVQFRLGSQNIGSPVKADQIDHAWLTWDSHGIGNGSYSLTAVALDAAGHSKTSVAVPVTVSN